MLNFRQYVEDAAGGVDWYTKTRDNWMGKLDLDGIAFKVNLYREPYSSSWSVSFDQLGDSYTYQPVSMPTIIKLFQSLDRALVELFQTHDYLKRVMIHPEAFSADRKNKVKQRYGAQKIPLGNLSIEDSFDLGKFHAYQYLFQHSQLHKLGFRMETKGQELIIIRPEV